MYALICSGEGYFESPFIEGEQVDFPRFQVGQERVVKYAKTKRITVCAE